MGVSVVVVGGGGLGLTAAKCFKEEGFDVTLYEGREYVGGIWRDQSFAPDRTRLSAHSTTEFNSSKARIAASDWALPDSADMFPTAGQLHEYWKSYVEHFGLGPHIHLGHKVVGADWEKGRWRVTTQKKGSDGTSSAYFDKVYMAMGTFTVPRRPKIEGIDKFHGKVIHSLELDSPEPFTGENVMVVGLHATAQDMTHVLSTAAKKVYMAHRQGLALMSRWTPDGRPFDVNLTLKFQFFQMWLGDNIPSLLYWTFDKIIKSSSKQAFPNQKESWGLQPVPSIAVATPLLADKLWPHLESGFAEPVPAIRRVTGPSTMELTDGRVLENIDSIVFCTGFNMDVPDQIFPRQVPGGPEYSLNPYLAGPEAEIHPNLYRNIISVHPDEGIRNSLAFCGHSAIPFPGFVFHEATAMAVAQIWKGKVKLPSYAEMLQERARHKAWRDDLTTKYKPHNGSTFYPIFMPFAEHFRWIDETAGVGITAHLGNSWFNWRAWKLWFQDRELYNIAVGGIFTPYLWRLFDMGRRPAMDWNECRAAIFLENKKVADFSANRRAELAAKAKSQ